MFGIEKISNKILRKNVVSDCNDGGLALWQAFYICITEPRITSYIMVQEIDLYLYLYIYQKKKKKKCGLLID